MCDRFAISRDDGEIAAAYEAIVVGAPSGPSLHVVPQHNVRVVLERSLPWADSGQDSPSTLVRQLRTVRWGLVPFWANDPKIGTRLISAASKSITEKAAFRRAAASRRCIVPADGFSVREPGNRGGERRFRHPDDELLAMAGLYELWAVPARHENDSDRWLWTMAVVTTVAVEVNGTTYDRSPLILPAGMIDDWLDPQLKDLAEVRRLVAAVPNPDLDSTPQTSIVDAVPGDGQQSSARPAQLPTQRVQSVRRWFRRGPASLRSAGE